jgi:small subunit ribosomal protein S1
MSNMDEIKVNQENVTEITEEKAAQETDQTNYEALYGETFGKSLSIGAVITGTVVQIDAENIMIDVGRKMEGSAPLKEFLDENGNINVSIGDEVEVLVLSLGKNIRLSKERARSLKVWDDIIKAYQDKTTISGRVLNRIKGGLMVDIGVQAFLPSSHASLSQPTEADLEKLIGTKIDVTVIKYNRKKNNVVVSHRDVLESERAAKKKVLLETINKGDVVKGTVKNILAYGAFVDIGGIDGLLHITDMSWGKLKDPKEKVASGQVIDVKIIDFDPETEKISLGIKQLSTDPWEGIEYRYPIGKKVSGKVTSLTNYGAFVELEEGVEGLVHISEMFWSKKIRHPSSVLKEDEEVEVQILGVDQKERRISLGLKQTTPNPWDLLSQNYIEGAVVDAKVKNVTDFGIFVSIDENIDIDGLIHVSDISWDPKVKSPKDMFKKGDVLKAKVLTIDQDSERFSLGIKQLEPDPWTQIANDHPAGSIIKGKITSITDFGAFVEIAQGIEGMIHISEVSRDKIESLAEVLKVGQEVEAVVLRVSPENKKIGLSIKALDDAQTRKSLQETSKAPDKVATNLGDLLKGWQKS